MRHFLKFFFIILLPVFHNAKAENKHSLSGGVNLASKQYWRGVVYSHAPVVQPEITFKSGRFSLTLWGSRAIDLNYAEINIIPSYTLGDFSLTIYDYYNPVNDGYNHYFDFSDSTNRHSTELMASWEPQNMPLKLMAATFFYNDKHPATRKAYYSTYLEAGVPFMLGPLNAEVSLGMTPFMGYYASRTTLIQARVEVSKTFQLAKQWTMPANISFNANPTLKTMHMLFNLGFFFNQG